MRTPHTACRRGKRIRVVLITGEKFIDRFWERSGRYVYFKKHPRVLQGDIKAFTIIKGITD
jgi:hypothetical protein